MFEGAAGHQQSGDHWHHLPLCKPHSMTACMFLLCLEFMSVHVCSTCLHSCWADVLQERSGKAQSQCWLLSVFHVGQTLSEHLTGVTQLVCKLYSFMIHATCLPHELESILIISNILITCRPLESVTYSPEYLCLQGPVLPVSISAIR